MAKISRTGKKKKSVYQKSNKGMASASKQPTTEEKANAKKQLRFSILSLILLLISLIFILFAPKMQSIGLNYHYATAVAYFMTTAAGVSTILGVKYSPPSRQTSSRFVGALLLFIGLFGLLFNLFPNLVPFGK